LEYNGIRYDSNIKQNGYGQQWHLSGEGGVYCRGGINYSLFHNEIQIISGVV